MTEKEQKLQAEISEYLLHPLDPNSGSWPQEQLDKMAEWLMSFAPGRYRMISIRLRNVQQPFVVRDANDALKVVSRQISSYGSVKVINEELPKIVQQTTDAVNTTRDIVEKAVSSSSSSGKRTDHEQLPPEIRALYEENLPLLQRQRSKFEKMKLIYQNMRDKRSNDGLPCDIEEACHALQDAAREVVEMNDRRLSNWQKYDSYNVSESVIADEPKVQVKDVNATYISKNIEKLVTLSEQPENRVEFVKLQKKIQQRVEQMESDGWRVEKAKWIESFEKSGVKYQKK